MNRALLIGFSALVAVAIGGGLWVVGSPTHARHQKQDEARLSALLSWQSKLRCLARTDALPETLETAAACPDTGFFDQGISAFDPVTGAPYAYSRLSDQAFEVCATLALDPRQARSLRANMVLRAGNIVCVESAIDSDD